MQHVLEKILQHKGVAKTKTSMTFLCKWEGLSEHDNSWESWNSIKKDPILHDYCMRNNLKSAIPKNFKEATLERFKGLI